MLEGTPGTLDRVAGMAFGQYVQPPTSGWEVW